MSHEPACDVSRGALILADTMSEAEFQRHVTRLAEQLGWAWHHQRYSIGSKAGMPDLTLWRPPDQLIFAELKRSGRGPTPLQAQMISSLRQAGQRVLVWTPRDWDEIHEALR